MTRFSNPIGRRAVLSGLGSLPVVVALKMPAIAQASEIPIGMVLPFSGATGPYGPDMKKAADLVVAKINDAGGILGGRKLKL